MAINFDIFGTSLNQTLSKDIVLFLAIFIAAWIVLWAFKHFIVHRLKAASKRTETKFDDLLIKIFDVGGVFYTIVAFYISMKLHPVVWIPATIRGVIDLSILFVITFYIILGVQRIVDYVVTKSIEKKLKQERDDETHIIDFMGKLVKIGIWVFGIVFIVDNLGYNVSTLVAGLGIGGLAIAFAFQSILQDVFASFSIYFDKPFKRGDYIVFGADSGVVGKIGIKSTRINTLSGQELIVSNKELTSTRINNFKQMKKRRITFDFGVTYQVPAEKAKKIPGMVKKIIEKIEHTEFDRAHFITFGDFALMYQAIYYVTKPDYALYRDIQQEINLEMMKVFQKNKIEFAYPTQTLMIEKFKKGR